MKFLVTGIKGQLGYDVCRELKSRGYQDVCGIDIDDLDITDEKAVSRFVREYHPDVVMHNAAFTAVDRAEAEPGLCRAVNAFGTKYLAEAARECDAKFVYISTDYVFDGEKEGLYSPEDRRCPLSVYGATKSEGEDAVRAATEKHFIVRISWVFGVNGKNFVKTMLNASEKRSEFNVVCDQVGSPTYTADLAKLLVDMTQTEQYGTYHASNEGICSWYEFACEIFRLAGKNVKVNPVTTEEYLKLASQQAKRPKNSRFDKSKLTERGFSLLPDWKDALQRYIREIYHG